MGFAENSMTTLLLYFHKNYTGCCVLTINAFSQCIPYPTKPVNFTKIYTDTASKKFLCLSASQRQVYEMYTSLTKW